MTNARTQKIVLVKSGGETFGLSVFAVRDMTRALPVLPVPLAPAGVAGVLNLRGKLVTALQLSSLLGLPATEAGIMVVVENEQELTALLVDAVLDVIAVKADAIAKPSAALEGKARSLVTGSVAHGDGQVHLLDIARLTA